MSDRPDCKDEQQRRSDVLEHPTLNAIDYVEVDAADHRVIRVFFLKSLPPAAYGLAADPSRIAVTGGTRVVGIRAVSATRKLAGGQGYLEVVVDQAGDFSPYVLELDADQLDPVLRRIPLSFMASCPVDVDCPSDPECPPEELEEPDLDYLAKDYASFRRLLLDLLPRLNPSWTERNPADLGIALVELLAHEGDHLSYFQDAVANEAYLETARRRISARRHARLVDYRMHDGRNAWTWVHVAVAEPGVLRRGSRVVTRVANPLAGEVAPPGPVISPALLTADALERDPALTAAVVFETAHDQELAAQNNLISIHAFGNEECCLPIGTREAFLFSVPAGTTAVRPVLARGDMLVLEEVRGPATGAPADADPDHRRVVVIDEDPEEAEDPVYTDTVVGGALERFAPGRDPLPLLRVRWRREDALDFPLCLSARTPELGAIRDVSVARGNVVLADHGITTAEEVTLPEPVAQDEPFRLKLGRGPLTMECRPAGADYDAATALPVTDRRDLACDVREAQPAVALLADFVTGDRDLWTPVPDLLDSPPFAQDFVAEVDDDGRAVIRFGEGEYGREPAGAFAFRAVYRIGNGRSGNVGAESLSHLAPEGAAPEVLLVRNPLAAQGGVDPETVEEVRQLAPRAFRARQFRAVTESDYAEAANELPGIAGAVATFRWTGSWYTVFVGVDPEESTDLVNLPDGRTVLDPGFEERVRAGLTRFRLAGYDLEIRAPRFVPLQLELDVCAAPGHFRSDVAAAVLEALSARTRGGLFNAANFTFAQPVHLSRIYAAVERVEGVDSAVVRTFRRYGRPDNQELEQAVVPIGAWEVARLENDPSFVEHGVLDVSVRGGKA